MFPLSGTSPSTNNGTTNENAWAHSGREFRLEYTQSPGAFQTSAPKPWGPDFGQVNRSIVPAIKGTPIKIIPVVDTETEVKVNNLKKINIRYQSITVMKEYENKSFDELRWEDYQANKIYPGSSTSPILQPTSSTLSKPFTLSTPTNSNTNPQITFGRANLARPTEAKVQQTLTQAVSFNPTSALGTTIPFNPNIGSDYVDTRGQNRLISTRYQCITCMPEYRTKSFEELRWEDYQVNRRGLFSGFGDQEPNTIATFNRQPGAMVDLQSTFNMPSITVNQQNCPRRSKSQSTSITININFS